MTTFNAYTARNRDMQDGIERHVWGELEYINGAGSVIKVRGTDTGDEEATVMNSGYGFNLPKDFDAEVMLTYGSSDTNQKYATLQIPHNYQRQWGEGTGGIQHPMDPDRALEFNDERAHLLDKLAVLAGVLEVVDGQVYIRGNLSVDGDIGVTGSSSVNGARIGPLPAGAANVTVPGFNP